MHDEILTKNAAELLPCLHNFEDFYLVGGTALALQIGHRRSIDFDLFSRNPLPADILTKAKRIFKDFPITLTYRSPEQLNLIVNDVKITFFFYDYPVIDSLLKFNNISLVSIPEIAAMKAFAIGKRLSYKDYVDWYFMLKECHTSLTDVIKHAQEKFANDFNDRLFLGQLCSLQDVPTQQIDFIGDEVSREVIAEFLENAVKDFEL